MKLAIELTNDDRIKLLEHGLIDVNSYHNYCAVELLKTAAKAVTTIYHMLIYGYVANCDILRVLGSLAPHELNNFWTTYEPLLKARYGNSQLVALYDESIHRHILEQA